MKKLIIVSIFMLSALASIVFPNDALACRPPDTLEVSIEHDMLTGKFSWDEINGPLNCSADEAMEIEFIIESDPQKCFAQPENGRDENMDHATIFNFDGYTDVWNYFFDYSSSEIKSIINAKCGEFPYLEALMADIFDTMASSIEDTIANFAIGTDNTMQFKTGTSYGFTYKLYTVNDRPECKNPGALDGYVTVNMAVFPKTCTLPPSSTDLLEDIILQMGSSYANTNVGGVTMPFPPTGVILPLENRQFTCPHFIGFVNKWFGCKNITNDNYKRYTLQNRLCAPTNGIWVVDNPGNDRIKRGGGYCFDSDQDGKFVNVPGYEMYGNNVNDCLEPNYTPGMTDGIIAYPPENEDFYSTLVVVPIVQDNDGIQQFTITIDGLQTEACKKRFYPVLKTTEWQEYLLLMNLPNCLGTDYGDHSFKIWTVDQCGLRQNFNAIPFSYVSQSTTICSYPPWGQIDSISYDSDTYQLDYDFAVMDNDGVVFATLALNGINEDRCKLRHYFTPNPGTHSVLDMIQTDVPVEYCLLKDPLKSAQLWVADKCGNVTMVHNFDF